MVKTPREAYRDFKPRYQNELLAFASGEVIEFVHSDAHEVARLIQLEVSRPNGYDVAMAHRLRLPEIRRRLGSLGRKVVVVRRQRTPSGKVSYRVEPEPSAN